MYDMKCLILAAGKGVRMLPLTEDRPKPLIEIAGKSLLERLISVLPESVTEVGVVIGYKGEMIRERLQSARNGKAITYIEEEQLLGTWHALEAGKSYLA